MKNKIIVEYIKVSYSGIKNQAKILFYVLLSVEHQ